MEIQESGRREQLIARLFHAYDAGTGVIAEPSFIRLARLMDPTLSEREAQNAYTHYRGQNSMLSQAAFTDLLTRTLGHMNDAQFDQLVHNLVAQSDQNQVQSANLSLYYSESEDKSAEYGTLPASRVHNMVAQSDQNQDQSTEYGILPASRVLLTNQLFDSGCSHHGLMSSSEFVSMVTRYDPMIDFNDAHRVFAEHSQGADRMGVFHFYAWVVSTFIQCTDDEFETGIKELLDQYPTTPKSNPHGALAQLAQRSTDSPGHSLVLDAQTEMAALLDQNRKLRLLLTVPASVSPPDSLEAQLRQSNTKCAKYSEQLASVCAKAKEYTTQTQHKISELERQLSANRLVKPIPTNPSQAYLAELETQLEQSHWWTTSLQQSLQAANHALEQSENKVAELELRNQELMHAAEAAEARAVDQLRAHSPIRRLELSPLLPEPSHSGVVLNAHEAPMVSRSACKNQEALRLKRDMARHASKLKAMQDVEQMERAVVKSIDSAGARRGICHEVSHNSTAQEHRCALPEQYSHLVRQDLLRSKASQSRSTSTDRSANSSRSLSPRSPPPLVDLSASVYHTIKHAEAKQARARLDSPQNPLVVEVNPQRQLPSFDTQVMRAANQTNIRARARRLHKSMIEQGHLLSPDERIALDL